MTDLFDLSGRHALVTGASSGLGRHFAATLAKAGASLTLTGRRDEELAKTVREVEALGGRAKALVMDVRDPAAIEQGLDAAETALGPVTVLINNAGIGAFRSALDVSEAEWDDEVDTNLKGAWLMAQGVGRRMIKANAGGSIVNITSILATRVIEGVAPYVAAKAGLEQLTKLLALEWVNHDIRVNALAPGFVRTEFNDAFFDTAEGLELIERIPQRRLGAPADLDGALLLLASDAGSFMTGSVITVDGGHLVSRV